MFLFDPWIKYEHLNMLKILNVRNLSDGKTSLKSPKNSNPLTDLSNMSAFVNAYFQTKVSNSLQEQQVRSGNVKNIIFPKIQEKMGSLTNFYFSASVHLYLLFHGQDLKKWP